LVEFGSVVNAVECTVQLQDAMAAANADLPEARWIVLRSEDLGERSLKNIAEPVQIYRVSGATPAALAAAPSTVVSSPKPPPPSFRCEI
jgi:class 3 adenylate cyclase